MTASVSERADLIRPTWPCDNTYHPLFTRAQVLAWHYVANKISELTNDLVNHFDNNSTGWCALAKQSQSHSVVGPELSAARH